MEVGPSIWFVVLKQIVFGISLHMLHELPYALSLSKKRIKNKFCLCRFSLVDETSDCDDKTLNLSQVFQKIYDKLLPGRKSGRAISLSAPEWRGRKNKAL